MPAAFNYGDALSARNNVRKRLSGRFFILYAILYAVLHPVDNGSKKMPGTMARPQCSEFLKSLLQRVSSCS